MTAQGPEDSDRDERPASDGGDPRGGESDDDHRLVSESRLDPLAETIGTFVRVVEVAAAAVFALLFGIGVVDLALQILEAIRNGAIADPLVVIGFIDTGLLLLIIVEVYQTVVAYIEQNDTRRIVRLVIYTGVIAMVRKAIIFRTGEYASEQSALLAAVAYTTIILGLVALLYVERMYGEQIGESVA